MTEQSKEAVEAMATRMWELDPGFNPEYDAAKDLIHELLEAALPIELEKARQRWEQEVRERLGKPVTELIEYLVYSECARCELVNPERDACQCAVCDRLAVLIRNLRTESKALGVFGEEGENGG